MMKKRTFRILSVACYSAGLILAGFYIKTELSPLSFLTPGGRVVLLGLCCLGLYCGSRFMGGTLQPAGKARMMKMTCWLFFAIYIVLLMTLVLFDSMMGRKSEEAHIFMLSGAEVRMYLEYTVNIVPFKGMEIYVMSLLRQSMSLGWIVMNVVGNLLAFMPFALFLPILTPINTLNRFFFAVLMTVLSVELLQLITLSGRCDIDDIMLNMWGALLAYIVLNCAAVRKGVARVLVIRKRT